MQVRLQGWWKWKIKKVDKRIFKEATGLADGKLDHLPSFSATNTLC